MITPARSVPEIAEIRRLFIEYAESLNYDLCFQGFDEEIETLPGRYAPPAGELLLATIDGGYIGGVGARPLEDGICEMKRLYVRPGHRGLQIGRRLADAIIEWAGLAGYRAMRLDTLATMAAAQAMYRELGFRKIEPYYHNPIPGASYYELVLRPPKRS